ncbi:unnamed protein product [Rotaria sordida]|uniref:Uncharacterized protein n=1 Tax=Rotaria sordida TaxID=392033 RepID=A0A815VHN4_9BILA|nr:unnamed protein product [Rotaria sordida]
MCDQISSNMRYFNISEPGKATAALENDAETQVLNLVHTELAQSPDSVQLFWSYPTKIMSSITERPFTEQRRPYTVSLHAESLRRPIKNVYRVLNGQQTEIPISNGNIIQQSNSDYQVILQFQAPPNITTYGTYIKYDILPS